jgi:hypothetical protein
VIFKIIYTPSFNWKKMVSPKIQALPKGIFEEGLTGVKGFLKNIPIALSANKSDYKLEEMSRLERNYVVGVAVNSPLNTSTPRASATEQLTSRDIIDSCKLYLQIGSEVIIDGLPLADILKANNNGYWFDLHIGERVNLSDSKLYVAKNDTIQANDRIELTFLYVKLKN